MLIMLLVVVNCSARIIVQSKPMLIILHLPVSRNALLCLNIMEIYQLELDCVYLTVPTTLLLGSSRITPLVSVFLLAL